MVGYYLNDIRCGSDAVGANGFQLTTQGNDWAPACDSLVGEWNWVGTDNEPIEHIACEFAWYLYNNFAVFGTNVKIVAHSMGGTITRYMIERVQAHDGNFPPFLYVSDVVTISGVHAGLSKVQATQEYFACGECFEDQEMEEGSTLMNDIYNHDDPQANGGTDWTMMGSLSTDDPLDWFWQATYLSGGHRLGYSYPIYCNGQPDQQGGYTHGSYVNDMCDAYDAPQYYQDFDSRDSQSYYYTTSAPHSLHNMILAFTYYGW